MYGAVDDATMADTEQDRTLSEMVVMELIEQGLDSSMRDSILEAVEESEGSAGDSSSLPLAGALLGLGAAVGYLAGRESSQLEDVSLEDVQEPEIIEDVTGESEEETEAEDAEAEAETAGEEGGSSGILGRLVLAVAAIAAVALIRRRLSGGEDEEWEPIEEFEPATDLDEESEESDEDAEAIGAGEETEE
jgi:hypothetical protein